MTATKETQGTAKGKPSKARIENLAQLLAGILADPTAPAALRQHIRYGLSEVFNDLHDNNRVTDSPEYITRLLTLAAEDLEGGGR